MTTSTTTITAKATTPVDVTSGEHDDGVAFARIVIGGERGVALALHSVDPDVFERVAAACAVAANEIRDLHDAARVGAA